MLAASEPLLQCNLGMVQTQIQFRYQLSDRTRTVILVDHLAPLAFRQVHPLPGWGGGGLLCSTTSMSWLTLAVAPIRVTCSMISGTN